MQTAEDKNVIYGGDPEESTKIDENCPSLGHMVLEDLKLGEVRPLLINGITGATWTFKDLLEQSKLMARVLYGAGLRRNDTISIVAENRLEYPAIAFGAFYLNAIVSPINVTYTKRELKHAFDLSKPKFVFVSKYAAKQTIATCQELSYVKNVILFDHSTTENKTVSLNDFVKKNEKKDYDVEKFASIKVDIKDQVSLIVCSSGTTGMPKGVLLTHENLMSVLQSYRDHFVLLPMVLEEPIRVLNIAPWFHALGFMSMFLVACSRGATCVFMPKFEEEPYLKAIEQHKVNVITVVPPIMVFLAKSPLFDKYDLSRVREIGCGAAALSKELEDQVRERFKGNVTIRQGYGMSETTLGTLGTNAIIKPGSVGEPLKGVYAKVIDEDGKTLGVNQRGELCFKGNRIMKGYINDDRSTNDIVDADGWLHSGDIGYYDEDFQFYIVDRLKELIKYKAFQVPPAEIEGLLLSHPKIKDCGVIGIPDELSGELPFAFVVKQPGVNLTEQEVVNYVAENSSKAKWIRGGVRFIDIIPKNPSGKILRRELRDLFKSTKSKL